VTFPVPRSIVARTAKESTKAYEELGGSIAVVKAQILAGGREKGTIKTNSQQCGIYASYRLAYLKLETLKTKTNTAKQKAIIKKMRADWKKYNGGDKSELHKIAFVADMGDSF
jgi:succinyl-CoA synthetase beta subunit